MKINNKKADAPPLGLTIIMIALAIAAIFVIYIIINKIRVGILS